MTAETADAADAVGTAEGTATGTAAGTAATGALPHSPAATAAGAAGTARSAGRVLVVIPARGGSKGVPGKNALPVAGVPLVARAARAAAAASRVDEVLVSTDDDAIADAVAGTGARVLRRPDAISGDLATSESAVLHALDAHDAEQAALAAQGASAGAARVDGSAPLGLPASVVVLVQCTSPFITPEEIDEVVAAVQEGGADSALTVAPFPGFLWREAPELPAGVLGVNHDVTFRPRRQDRPEDLLETGAAYAMRADGFRTAGFRFFGRTALVRTDPARVLEIDEPRDLDRARALAPVVEPAVHAPTSPASSAPAVPAPRTSTADVPSAPQATAGPLAAAAPGGPLPGREDVAAVVLDFDGTQTDDRVWIDADGHELVAVHRGDGLGVARLRRAGVKVLILSTETNPVVSARARKLGVPVLQGIERKDAALREWCAEQAITPEQVLYLGNDINDLPCFDLVGWPVAVADAHPHVRERARAVTSAPGGRGAVRDLATWLLGKEL